MLLYQKKGSTDKRGKAPIMGRITLNRSNLFACQSKNSMAQFSCKLSCTTNLWNPHSGMTSKSAFIKARIFGEPFHVVTFDKSQHEYYAKFFAVQSGKAERSDFHAQFRMVGINYNQTLKELKSLFSERRTMALVCKLKKYMMLLVQIIHKVVELTDKYKNTVK